MVDWALKINYLSTTGCEAYSFYGRYEYGIFNVRAQIWVRAALTKGEEGGGVVL